MHRMSKCQCLVTKSDLCSGQRCLVMLFLLGQPIPWEKTLISNDLQNYINSHMSTTNSHVHYQFTCLRTDSWNRFMHCQQYISLSLSQTLQSQQLEHAHQKCAFHQDQAPDATCHHPQQYNQWLSLAATWSPLKPAGAIVVSMC